MVSPSAIQPANTKLIEARRSVAITSAGFNFSTPRQIAVLPSISPFAPIRLSSGMCIKRFSKMVSVMRLVPSAIAFNKVNCACISVGKPGCGIVRIFTAFGRCPFESSVMVSSVTLTSIPASRSFSMTASRVSALVP